MAYIVGQMKYTPRHAAQALEIMRRLAAHVPERKEYLDLISILESPSRWKEAHDQFSAIRTRLTLPMEERGDTTLEYHFVFVAENAAKTGYNCSGEPAPFDEDSFEALLICEREFVERLKTDGQPARPSNAG